MPTTVGAGSFNVVLQSINPDDLLYNWYGTFVLWNCHEYRSLDKARLILSSRAFPAITIPQSIEAGFGSR